MRSLIFHSIIHSLVHRIDIRINEIADFNRKCMQGIWLTVAFHFPPGLLPCLSRYINRKQKATVGQNVDLGRTC